MPLILTIKPILNQLSCLLLFLNTNPYTLSSLRLNQGLLLEPNSLGLALRLWLLLSLISKSLVLPESVYLRS